MTNDDIKQIFAKLEDHERRLSVLELGSSSKHKNMDQTIRQKNYSGATGGVRFLVKNLFFKIKRNQAIVREELSDKGYHYSSQAIYEAMKILSKSGGPLVALSEKGRKVYVERK